MIKRDELVKGCMAKAREDEMTFVLLARDPSAPDAIRYWTNRRVEIRKNKWEDAQIVEAESCAQTMERQRAELPDLPKAAELTGSDPDFTGDQSTDEYVAQIRGRQVAPADGVPIPPKGGDGVPSHWRQTRDATAEEREALLKDVKDAKTKARYVGNDGLTYYDPELLLDALIAAGWRKGGGK